MSSQENPSNSVLSLLQTGQLAKEADAKIDSRIFDPETHQPILIGNSNPEIIGPDDHYDFEFRRPEAYPEVPPHVKNAEIRYILPMAKFIAGSIGITVLDESAYERVLEALRTRSLFVLLNIHKTKIADGVASWFGLILMCKRMPLVMVHFKMRLATEQIGISHIRLWDSGKASYIMHRDSSGAFFDREQASALILNYLKVEGVLPDL